MKTNMKKAIVPALFAMAFAAGCGTPPEPPPPTVNEILASKNITLDFPAAGKGGPAKGVAPGDEAAIIDDAAESASETSDDAR